MPSMLYFNPSTQPTSYSSPHPYDSSSPTQNSPLSNPLEAALIGVSHPPLSPPDVTLQRKAMEAAAAKERQRAKEMERDEIDMTADELRAVLKRERHRQARMAADLAAMKYGTMQSQLEAEVSEEGRINELMRRVDHAKQQQKTKLTREPKHDEMVNKNITPKRSKVRRDKVTSEKQIARGKKNSSTMRDTAMLLGGVEE